MSRILKRAESSHPPALFFSGAGRRGWLCWFHNSGSSSGVLGANMNPVEDTYPGAEREWDSFTIVRADFRRHWNGHLVNLFAFVPSSRTMSDAAALASGCTQDIAGWVLTNRQRFGPEDRFQIVVACRREIPTV
jgi:hypothetical protein